MNAPDLPLVVFVDGDDTVLDALRAVLRRDRATYDFVFTNRGADAWTILGERSAAVVVTDILLPDVDGVELLRRIRSEHPAVVCYALTADGTEDAVRRATPLVHRWLSKPCEHHNLMDAVAAAVRYRRLLEDPALAAAIGGVASLPSVPRLYGSMMALTASDTASAESIAEVAASDPAIAAKLLQLANSAFMAGERVDDLTAAVVRVGIANIVHIVLSQEVLALMEGSGQVPGFDADGLHEFATAVGERAAELARRADQKAAHVAGLLMAAGLLVESTIVADRLRGAYDHAASTGVSLIEAERELFGLAHPDIAGHLLSIWGLPGHLVDAVAGAFEVPEETEAPMSLADAVRVARLEVLGGTLGTAIGAPHHPDGVVRTGVPA